MSVPATRCVSTIARPPKARGLNLTIPAPNSGTKYSAVEPNVQVQLFSSTGECWGSEFVTPTKNEGKQFKAKSIN